MIAKVVQSGGITIKRDPLGNIQICARGDGCVDIQQADIDDLFAALLEMMHAPTDEDT